MSAAYWYKCITRISQCDLFDIYFDGELIHKSYTGRNSITVDLAMVCDWRLTLNRLATPGQGDFTVRLLRSTEADHRKQG